MREKGGGGERKTAKKARGKLVDDAAGFAYAECGGGKFFPGVAAANAVGRQANRALERTHGAFGVGAKNAVQCAGGVAQSVQCVLANQHIGAAAASAHGGVSGGGAAARRRAIPAIHMHPGWGVGLRLH